MNPSKIKSSINVVQWHYEENCLKEDKQLQEISRAHEASYFQANKINDDAGHEVKKENINRIKGKFQNKFKSPDKKCFRCGKTDHFAKSPKCPAKSAECHKCHKEGHFASVCRTVMKRQ
jgi:hypothetical protein